MAESSTPSVAVVGAGIAGSLLAAILGRRGIPVTLYERGPDPRAGGAGAGRSINLALSERGLTAAERIGMREALLAEALPMRGRMIHAPTTDGTESFRPYSADGRHAINSISRSRLGQLLLDAADGTDGVTVVFEHRLEDLDLETGTLTFEVGHDQGERRTAQADIVLAADGAYSAARLSILRRRSVGFSYIQDFLGYGYKELVIPARDGEYALDPTALHIWPRGESMMIALPNRDRSFTCTLFWPQRSFDALSGDDQVLRYFSTHYPDAVPLMPTLVEDYRANPVGALATVRCWPWVHRGAGATLALVGDAAHAVVPFYGQGANASMEDCAVLDDCLTEAGGNWQRALEAYQQSRKANADAIADMALDNLVEMSDKVNSPVFRAATAGQHALERVLGDRYQSRYEMVSFTTIPYADVVAKTQRQNRATAGVAAAVAGLTGLASAYGVHRLRGGSR